LVVVGRAFGHLRACLGDRHREDGGQRELAVVRPSHLGAAAWQHGLDQLVEHALVLFGVVDGPHRTEGDHTAVDHRAVKSRPRDAKPVERRERRARPGRVEQGAKQVVRLAAVQVDDVVAARVQEREHDHLAAVDEGDADVADRYRVDDGVHGRLVIASLVRRATDPRQIGRLA